MRRLHGVVYPDPVPPAGGPVREAALDDEAALALRFVRAGFTPPLPDEFADWYRSLLDLVREGSYADTLVSIPQAITNLGYTFDRAMHAADRSLTLTLADALGAFGRDDLLRSEHDGSDGARPGVVRSSTEGFTSLAAALMARGIRAVVTLHRNSGTCSLGLTGTQAVQVAELLIPAEGSTEDELAIALGLLDCLAQDRDLSCYSDQSGRCQEHSCSEYEGKCAEPQAHAFLVRHNVREGT